MKIIFIGNPLPHKATNWLLSDKLHISQAGNTAQCDIIEGLSVLDPDITVISRSPIGKKTEFILDNGVKTIGVSNININKPVFYLSIIPGQFLLLKKVVKKAKGNKVIIITHNLPIYVSLPVIIIKSIYRNVIWIPYLIDPIVYKYQGFFGYISNLSDKLIRKADGVITYVKQSVADYAPELPYTIVNFSINNNLLSLYKGNIKKEITKKPIIAYTGSLISMYSIDLIIKVIMTTKNKYRWIFCGIGEFANDLKKIAYENYIYNINYAGIVSREQAAEIQANADLLLNIRGADFSNENVAYSSKYAASGKIYEYLASGTPILCTDIPAIPNEIKKYCILINPADVTVENIINKLEWIFKSGNYLQLLEMARNGQKYALDNFSNEKNNDIINDFIKHFIR